MAALVAALLTHASDRTPWTAALLGDRYANKAAVIAATALALAFGNALGVVGGVLVAPLLSPKASDLLLAFALLSAGGSALWPIKPAKLRDWRLGAFGASLVAIGMLGFGDRTQFITAALAARSTTPALAAVGATVGALAVNVPAILSGTRRLRRAPTTALRFAAAAVLLIFGAVQGLGALRLI
uniref:TMEM165/GDT1 family protein n=1 Tax=uncultured Sphingomonas sp. TaxID=158754 RepID=UPI0035C9EB82